MDIFQYSGILSKEDIDYLLADDNVVNAKKQIDAKTSGSVYFSVSLTETIKTKLNKIGLNLFNKNTIPMRWIKGDTQPHIDTSVESFENTYLIYLTNNDGKLVINNKSYPITEGSAYVFNEGIHHETIGTGNEPRLLLGPMSEKALSVGFLSVVYIRQSGFDIQESTDQINWTTISSWPYTVSTNVIFVSDITLTSSNNYFIINNSYITFGNVYLNNDGSRPIITIEDVTNYPGLVQNGNNSGNGFSYIGVVNLVVRAINGSTLADGAGWIGQQMFSKGASYNFIINCSSDGPIGSNSSVCGGIVGNYVAQGNSLLAIIGCSSTGNIGINSGGIVGSHAGNTGNVTPPSGGAVMCISCWSNGTIDVNGGGIYGEYAGEFSTTSATNCYTTGTIGINAGGIYGRFPGKGGNTLAENCYSLGSIDISGGGIYGAYAGFTGGDTGDISGNTQATNCYSVGVITTSGNGIYGSSKLKYNETNCYSANNSWSSTTANTLLTGTPTPIVGTTWVATIANQPYELKNVGYTPYETLILGEELGLNTTYSQTINSGNTTVSGLISGRSYRILDIEGGDSGSYNTITIDSITGAVSTTSSTASGVYTLYIRFSGSYYISTFILTVVGPDAPCFTEDTTVLTPNGYISIKELKKGDILLTSNNKPVPIINIVCRLVEGTDKTYPYIIDKSSIGDNYPPEKTLISGEHLIKNKNKWIHPKKSNKFEQDKSNNLISYYHIETPSYEHHNLVINGGLIVESHTGSSIRNQVIRSNRINPKRNVCLLKNKK